MGTRIKYFLAFLLCFTAVIGAKAQPFVPYRAFDTNDFLVVFPGISLRFHPSNNLVTSTNNIGLTNLILAIVGTNDAVFIGAGPGISVATNVAGSIYTINNLFSNSYVAAGSNVTVLTNGSTFTVSGQPAFTSSLATNFLTTNASQLQLTNVIREIAGTNAYVSAGTNVLVVTNGHTYTISVPLTNTTLIAGTNVTIQAVITDNFINYTVNASNATVAAGNNVTVTTNLSGPNRILYTVSANVPTVTTNIVSTNDSSGVTNLILSIATNNFSGSGSSNFLAHWVNTNKLGSSRVRQTATNLIDYFNVAASFSDTAGFLTNTFYPFYASDSDYLRVQIRGQGHGTQYTNGVQIVTSAASGNINSLSLGTANTPWWTIDQVGDFLPMAAGLHGWIGQDVGSFSHPLATLFTFGVIFSGGDGGPGESSANIVFANGAGAAINGGTSGIFFQQSLSSVASIKYIVSGTGAGGLQFQTAGAGLNYSVNPSGGPMAGSAVMTNGFKDILTTAISANGYVFLSYVAITNSQKAIVVEDFSRRTNGVSFRVTSSDNGDTNRVNWQIINVF